MTKMFGRQSSSSTKTILLKSPDSDRVREVVITEIVVPNSRNSVDKLSLMDRMDTKIMSKPSRKRRLDHLSQEEKIMRKKLKNREAAQTSRDRKKARLEELESAVCRLQKQCDQLYDKYHSVCLERDDLKRELSSVQDELWRSRVEGGLEDAGAPPRVLKDAAVMTEGPAVSSPPLPQGMTAATPQPPSAHNLHSLYDQFLRKLIDKQMEGMLISSLSPLHKPRVNVDLNLQKRMRVLSVIQTKERPTVSIPCPPVPAVGGGGDLADLADDVIDCWLSNSDKVGTPDFEELELFADSLFKQAMDFEEADKLPELPSFEEFNGDSMDTDRSSTAGSLSADSLQTFSNAASPLAAYNASYLDEMEGEHSVISNDIIDAQLEDIKPTLAVDECNVRVQSADQPTIHVQSADELGLKNVFRQSVTDKISVQLTEQGLTLNEKVQPHTIRVQSADKEIFAQNNICRSIDVQQHNKNEKSVSEPLINAEQQNVCVKSADTNIPKTVYVTVKSPNVCAQSADQTVPVVRPVARKKPSPQTVHRPVPRNARVKPADQSVDALKRVGRPYVPIQPRVQQSVAADLIKETSANVCVQSVEPIVLLCTQSADADGNVVFVGDIVMEEECCTTAVAEEVVVSDDSSSYCQDSSSYCQDTDDSDVEIVEIKQSPSSIVKNLGDEVQSDHGYESIGSPDSDVNANVDLRQLFPELW